MTNLHSSLTLDYCRNLDDCADIHNKLSLSTASEVYPNNVFYGSSYVVKRYAGLSPSSSLNGVWPHGIYYGGGAPRFELHYEYFVAYSFEQYLDAHSKFNELFRTLVLPPRIYGFACPYQLASYINHDDQLLVDLNPMPTSVLYFPSHSSLLNNVKPLIDSILDDVRFLRASFSRVNLCVFWKDYVNETYSSIFSAFDDVFCSGHQYDKFFLQRLHLLIKSHSALSGSSIGSHIWYGLLSDVDFLLPPSRIGNLGYPPLVSNGDPNSRIHLNKLNKENKAVERKLEFLYNRLKKKTFLRQSSLYSEISFFHYSSPSTIREMEAMATSSFSSMYRGFRRNFNPHSLFSSFNTFLSHLQ